MARRAMPWLPGVIAKALGIAGQETLSEKVGRLAEFQGGTEPPPLDAAAGTG
ncbi:hypothetical protein [Tropicimonas sp. IMCC34011]|uniref:hypothetical protein n=1 Tax=Tropicimonas sp. IMCC34011 TaxID=2248759 RepID=UPI0013001F37|nr:hypothetical protein [Tropicimonas sp. IMCC34011]